MDELLFPFTVHDSPFTIYIFASAVHCPMRKMTNSAGRKGATPIRQTSRPLSRSFCVIVERSQRTKKDFSGLSPRSAPICHSFRRKSEMVRRTLAQSSSPFGSNTAHCVPLSIECSRGSEEHTSELQSY